MDVIKATAVGQGHDLSHGWLVDYGSDEYFGPGLGLGGGNDNGLGSLLKSRGTTSTTHPMARRMVGPILETEAKRSMTRSVWGSSWMGKAWTHIM